MDDETKYFPSNEKKAREDLLKRKIPLIKPLQFLIIKYETTHPEYSKEYLKNEKELWRYYKCTPIEHRQIILKRRMIANLVIILCSCDDNLTHDPIYIKKCKQFNCDKNLNHAWSHFGH
jgi:hypothetical protein